MKLYESNRWKYVRENSLNIFYKDEVELEEKVSSSSFYGIEIYVLRGIYSIVSLDY